MTVMLRVSSPPWPRTDENRDIASTAKINNVGTADTIHGVVAAKRNDGIGTGGAQKGVRGVSTENRVVASGHLLVVGWWVSL